MVLLLLNNLKTFKMLIFFTVWQIISLAIKYTMQLLTSPVLCFARLQVAQGYLSVLHLSSLRVKLSTIQLRSSPLLRCFSTSFKVTRTLPSTIRFAAGPGSENVVVKMCSLTGQSYMCHFSSEYFFLM